VVLALVLALALTGASIVPAAGAGGGDAVAAKKKKKKCPPGTHKVVKKKKNGKKKIKCVPNSPGTGTTPLVRATLTWTGAGSNDADLDLFVFDASGNRAGNGADTIPNSSLSSDVFGPSGTETFTDRAPQPLRPLSFGVCYTVGGSVHAPFTITYVTADGQSHTASEDPGSSFHYNYPGGPSIPSNYCPN
jgi:hypothetical protein